ncbi:unnamed protein product [Moneuplotes crassus]|uniref:Transmembrane protein n=1 Tax=Euplotes crassus TaxID=5936 RepID=A0AAD1XME0_EUPCR|nr:unnamed protein product [Moneuplotes crassus]
MIYFQFKETQYFICPFSCLEYYPELYSLLNMIAKLLNNQPKEYASQGYKMIDQLNKNLKWSQKHERYFKLFQRMLLASLMACVLLWYKYEIEYLSDNIYMISIFFCVSFAISKILLTVEQLEIKKTTKKIDKVELKIFSQKQKILKEMDSEFKSELKALIMKKVEIEKYTPSQKCASQEDEECLQRQFYDIDLYRNKELLKNCTNFEWCNICLENQNFIMETFPCQLKCITKFRKMYRIGVKQFTDKETYLPKLRELGSQINSLKRRIQQNGENS